MKKNKNKKRRYISAFASTVVAFITGWIGMPQSASAQNQNGDVHLCAAGGPCFTGERQDGNSVTFSWNSGGERYDFYNVRYASAGGEKQVENRSGHYTFNNIRSGGLYKISVQGCVKPVIGRSHCSDWVPDSIRTR